MRSTTDRRLEIGDICDTRDLLRSPHDCQGRNVSVVRLRNTRLTGGVPAFMSQARDTRSSGTGPSARIGYTRVSTVSQTLDQQNAALEAAGVTKTFSDTMSGARGLAALMEYVRDGDTVVVWKLDRLGRNTLHILETVKALTERGVTLVSVTDGIDSSTPAGRMMKERTALKRQASRANGTKFGRPRRVEDPMHIATAKRMKADGHTSTDIAKYLG
jgi:DNA invertase Pin-like site-specific DNA recombinase